MNTLQTLLVATDLSAPSRHAAQRAAMLVGAGVKPASKSRHKSGASNAVTAACNFGLRAQREGRPARGQRRSVQGLTEDGF